MACIVTEMYKIQKSVLNREGVVYVEKKRIINENSKDEQLAMVCEDPEREFLTTNQGVRVSNTDISLKAGEGDNPA